MHAAVSQLATYVAIAIYHKKELMPSVAFQMIKNRQKRMLHELQNACAAI